MIYRYTNEQGDEHQIVESMKTPPPEKVWINDDGSWSPTDTGGRHFWRVYECQGAVVYRGGAVCHKGQKIPESKTLPDDGREGKIVNRFGHNVREHSDGTYSTLDRRPIIDNKHARRVHATNTGFVEEG